MLGLRVQTCRQTSSSSADDRPERGHVPVEAPSQGREDALRRWLLDRGVGEDVEQLAGQLRPALELLLVAGPDDADDDRSRQRVVEDADDQLGADVGAVGPLDVHVERPADQARRLRVHEGVVVVADGRRERIGHEVEDGPPDQGAGRPAQEPLGRLVDVADGALVVGGHDGVAQPVEHDPDARDGPGRLVRRRGQAPGRHHRRHRRRAADGVLLDVGRVEAGWLLVTAAARTARARVAGRDRSNENQTVLPGRSRRISMPQASASARTM